ncbi:RsiV family protein [Cupriavidus basilensis]|uniref:RsiV family protein n=1 Tax=Cupriavidus basilensis TaxID=68895 RepID=A0ABT6APB6_9BURK|nr:RsiV family protein [Cupriavidus basilensis]MDF3834464.1 RsiV family protein [Cupriavidus basilensis]
MPPTSSFPPFAPVPAGIRGGLVQLGLAALSAAALLAGTPVRAAEPQASGGALWQGELEGRVQVSITLFPQAGTDRIDGTARYDSRLAATPRQLDGQLTSDGSLSWRERDAGGEAPAGTLPRNGARFEGTVAADGRTLSGQWTSADGTRRLPLSLTRKAVYRERSVDAGGVRLTERFPETGRPGLDALIASLRTSGCGDGERECRSAIELMRLDAGTVSLLRTTWRYSGGAHGSLDYAGGSWRRAAAEPASAASPASPQAVYTRILLGDLLQPGETCLARLNEELQAALKRQGAAAPAHGALGEQAVHDPLLPFTLYRGGVVLHYAPYAVGPFAQGSYQVAVPFARLGNCARPNGAGQDKSP